MRYVAYFLLVLLSVYFLIVKPIFTLRNFHLYVNGLTLDIKSLSFGIREFYFYYPSKSRDVFIGISGLFVKKTSLTIKEVNFITVGKVISKEPFDYDFSNLTKRLGRLNVNVDKLYVSINSLPFKESITVFVNNPQINKGVLSSAEWSQIYIIKGKNTRKVHVLINKARVDGSVLYVEDAIVLGENFVANLQGKWIGKKGTFSGKVEIDQIRKNNLIVAKTTAFFEGDVSYTFLNSNLKVFTPYVELIGKKKWENISGDLVFRYRLSQGMSLEGDLYSQNLKAQVDYTITPKSKLKVIFKGLDLDNKVLGIEQEASASLSGKLSMDLDYKRLVLNAIASPVRYGNYFFGFSKLDLDLDYKDFPKGKFYASFLGNGNMRIEGDFIGKDVKGKINFLDLEYSDTKTKALISYVGDFKYSQGILYTSGSGLARNLLYGEDQIGDFPFSFQLLGDTYNISLSGEGVRIVGSGSLTEKTFKGRASFDGFSYFKQVVSLKNISGTAELYADKNRTSFNGKLKGNLEIRDIQSSFDGTVKIENMQGISGNFEFLVKEINRNQEPLFNRAILIGRIKDNIIEGTYVIEDLSKGNFVYNLSKENYLLSGKVDKNKEEYSIAFNFNLSGSGKDFSMSVRGLAKYRGSLIPIDASLAYSQNHLNGYLKGFKMNTGLFDLWFDDTLIHESKVNWEGLRVNLGKEQLFTVSAKNILIDVQGRTFSFEGNIDGDTKGYIQVKYDPQKGLRARSEGIINMTRVSRITKSKLLGIVEGDIHYLYSFANGVQQLNVYTKDKISVLSRYLGAPMFGTLDITYNGNVANGKAKFEGNGSSVDLNFKGTTKAIEGTLNFKHILLVYRSDSFRYRGTSDGKMEFKTDFRSADVKGSVILKEGYIQILSMSQKEQNRKEQYKNLKINITFYNSDPLRIKLPEGSLVTNIKGTLFGNLYEPKYAIDVNLLGGKLTYFGKDFFIRQGEIYITHEDKKIEVSLNSPTHDYNIIMDVKGDINYPKVFVRSDPPRDQREVLSALIGGGNASRGLIAVDEAIVAQLPQLGFVKKTVSNVIGTDISINVSPVISGSETGINTKVSKEFTDKIIAEYQHSTLRNPKETYVEGSAKFVRGSSISARLYSDQSKEIRMRIQRKFDLK